MTTLNVLYLALSIGALLTFTVVVMYVTHLTNPAKPENKPAGLDTPAWRALAR